MRSTTCSTLLSTLSQALATGYLLRGYEGTCTPVTVSTMSLENFQDRERQQDPNLEITPLQKIPGRMRKKIFVKETHQRWNRHNDRHSFKKSQRPR